MALAQIGLPPGARGYLAAEQQAQESGTRNLANIGQITNIQGALQKLQQEQQMRAELAAADTDEKRAEVALRYGGPAAIMSHLDRKEGRETRSADRAAQMDTQLRIAKDKIDAGIEAARQRGEDQRTLFNMQLEGRKQMAQLAASMRQPPQPQPLQSVIGPDGKPILVERAKAVGMQPAPTGAGEPAGLSGEAAGKVAMADQAVSDIRGARDILFPDGKMDRAAVAAMGVPFTAGLPGHKGARDAYSRLHNAVGAKLRIETGAAATESEVKGILDRFMPRVLDDEQTAKDRMDRLETFMNTTIDLTKGVRPAALRSRAGQPAPVAPGAGGLTAQEQAELQQLRSRFGGPRP